MIFIKEFDNLYREMFEVLDLQDQGFLQDDHLNLVLFACLGPQAPALQELI